MRHHAGCMAQGEEKAECASKGCPTLMMVRLETTQKIRPYVNCKVPSKDPCARACVCCLAWRGAEPSTKVWAKEELSEWLRSHGEIGYAEWLERNLK